jgi:hypothetical protein
MVAAYRPRRELQKVAPLNFDAFFAKGQKKTVENSCGAVPRKGGPLLQFPASAGRFLLLYVEIKRLKQRKENIHDQRSTHTRPVETIRRFHRP